MALVALLCANSSDCFTLNAPTSQLNSIMSELLSLNQVHEDRVFRVDMHTRADLPIDLAGDSAVVVASDPGVPPPNIWSITGPRFVSTVRETLQHLESWAREGRIDELVLGNRWWWFDKALARRLGIGSMSISEDGMRPYMSRIEPDVWSARRLARVVVRPWLHAVTGARPLRPMAVWRSFPWAVGDAREIREIHWTRLSDLTFPDSEVVYPDDSAVLLSQTLSEDGHMSMAEEVTTIADSVERVLDDSGLSTVFLKPHPRDSESKVSFLAHELEARGAKVREHPTDRFPIESEFDRLRAHTVPLIGVWTASLFYYSAFWKPSGSISLLPAIAARSPYHAKVMRELDDKGLLDLVTTLRAV